MEQLQNIWNIMHEHFMMFMWFSWGLTTAQNSIRTTSDLDRFRQADTRSAENDRIGADTHPEYRIDASLISLRDQCNDSCYYVPWLCSAVRSRHFGAGCVVERSGTDISHTLSSFIFQT